MSSEIVPKRGHNWKHGLSKSRTYASWNQMIQRTTNPNTVNFERYGKAGVTVCDRWTGEGGFERFLADMGERPTPEHSIERIENDKGYSPDNCKWATDAEQRRNKSTNHVLTYNGQTLCLADWGAQTGMTGRAIYRRLKRGWSVEDALTKPLRITKLTHK